MKTLEKGRKFSTVRTTISKNTWKKKQNTENNFFSQNENVSCGLVAARLPCDYSGRHWLLRKDSLIIRLMISHQANNKRRTFTFKVKIGPHWATLFKRHNFYVDLFHGKLKETFATCHQSNCQEIFGAAYMSLQPLTNWLGKIQFSLRTHGCQAWETYYISQCSMDKHELVNSMLKNDWPTRKQNVHRHQVLQTKKHCNARKVWTSHITAHQPAAFKWKFLSLF